MTRTIAAILVGALLATLGALTPPPAALAQSFGLPLGDLYPTFVENDRVSTADVPAFTPFDWYLVTEFSFEDVGISGQDFVNGMGGWEARIDIDPNIIVTQQTLQPISSINVGILPNWIVGTGSLVAAASTPFTLVRFSGLLVSFDIEDLVVDLGAPVPSSFDVLGGPGPVPGWVEWVASGECADPCLRPFVDASSRLVVNCVNAPECNPVQGNGIEIAVGNGTVDVGPVEVPVTVQRTTILKAGDPSRLAGLDLVINWDPALASLDAVLLAPATNNWFMEYSSTAGTVDISMASLSEIDTPLSPLDVLRLQFTATGVEGETPLSVVDADAFDVEQMPIDITTSNGSLTTGCEKGDVIPDGEVNSADAIRTLLFTVGTLQPTPQEFCAADMNSDGIIDSGDVVLILRLAVGLPAAKNIALIQPTVFAQSGPELGDVVLHVDQVAGLEMVMSFDPTQVSFASATAPGSGGLITVNKDDPGVVRMAFAKSSLWQGEIHLKFDVQQPHSVLNLWAAHAFDEAGARHIAELWTNTFVFGVTAADDTPTAANSRFLGAYPNPFNPNTELRFSLARAGDASLKVFDAAGRQIRQFDLRGLAEGEHSVTWNGRDDQGATVASGAYLIQLDADGRVDTGRVVMLK